MLPPLPQPGLVLFPGYTAQRPETFLMKADSGSSTQSHYQVSFASPAGSPGAPLMRIDEEEKRTIVFRLPNGQEAMRVVKQVHNWSGKSPEYHGYTPGGRKIWHLSLKSGLLQTNYDLTIEPSGPYTPAVQVEKQTSNGSLGLLVNGCLAMSTTKPNILKWRRENVVYVAPGMDILLALGLNWIRYDKQDMDAKALGHGLGDAGDAVGDAGGDAGGV
ncbi:hypothetical protein SVAN01_04215 [Stagonosporopsis vannaccii]|nr:hypothetical protein SVAN01_04215 [Stagonosporopsis vannaccii]